MTLGPDALVLYVQPQSGDDSDPFGGIFGGGDGGGRDDGGSDGSIDGADNGSGDDLSVIRKFKRQTYNTPALVGGGSIHSSCADAHVYTVTADGTLTDNGLTVGAYPGFPNALLVGSSHPGSVQEGFGLGDLGDLYWISPDFPTFFAQFCVINGLVLAVFDGNNPDGCTPVDVFSGPFGKCNQDPAYACETNLTQLNFVLVTVLLPQQPSNKSKLPLQQRQPAQLRHRRSLHALQVLIPRLMLPSSQLSTLE
jgi:hypothetical protein